MSEAPTKLMKITEDNEVIVSSHWFTLDDNNTLTYKETMKNPEIYGENKWWQQPHGALTALAKVGGYELPETDLNGHYDFTDEEYRAHLQAAWIAAKKARDEYLEVMYDLIEKSQAANQPT